MEFLSSLEVLATITTLVLFIVAMKQFWDYYQDRKEKKLQEKPIETDVTYKKVMEEINGLSPYQRKKFKSSFNEVKVKWLVRYSSITDGNIFSKERMVHCFIGDKPLNLVNIKIDIEKFPIIKSAIKDDKFYITGIIKKVEDSKVIIKLIDLEKDKFFLF